LFTITKREKKKSELETVFHSPETVGKGFGRLIPGIPRKKEKKKKKEKEIGDLGNLSGRFTQSGDTSLSLSHIPESSSLTVPCHLSL